MQLKPFPFPDESDRHLDTDEDIQSTDRELSGPTTQKFTLSTTFPSHSISTPPIPLRVLTHNIRYATSSPSPGELPWPSRLPHLLSTLLYHTKPHFTPPTTLICLQEVLHSQLLSVLPPLHDLGYTYVGVGRDDGYQAGEYAPIFYRPDVWEKVWFETIWLNESGAVGKRGWDAASVRIVSCLVLELRGRRGMGEGGGKVRVLVMNTHLDDQGRVSRRMGAGVILDVARRLRREWRCKWWVLAGDLNSERTEGGGAWEVLNSEGSGFVDAEGLVKREERYGDEVTFTGFDGEGDGGGRQKIDFVHVPAVDTGEIQESDGKPVRGEVKGYAVLPNKFDDDVYVSDHRAVVVDVLLYPEE